MLRICAEESFCTLRYIGTYIQSERTVTRVVLLPLDLGMYKIHRNLKVKVFFDHQN